jgi:hypothetical protein
MAVIRARLIVALVTAVAAMVVAPGARADSSVTYEVVSDHVSALEVEYFDGVTRQRRQDIALPWRTTVSMADPGRNAKVRADWRPDKTALWKPGTLVTVRLYIDGSLGCEITVDVGNATCYGRIAPFGPNTIVGAAGRDGDVISGPFRSPTASLGVGR